MDFFDPNKLDDYLNSVENHKPDYNTNAESYYKALAKHKYFMKLFTAELIQLQNEMQQEFDEHKEITLGKIEEFNTRLDGIKEEMKDFFNQWLADGVLDEVINQDILNQKASKEDLEKTNQKMLKSGKLLTDSEFTDLCEKDVNGNVLDWHPALEKAFNENTVIRIPEGMYISKKPVIVTNPEFLQIIGLGLVILNFPLSSGIDLSTNIIVTINNVQIVGRTDGIPGQLGTFGLKLSCNRYSNFKTMRIKGFGIGIDFQSNKFSMNFDSLLVEYNRFGIVMQNANNNNMFLNCTIENNVIGVDICVTSGGNSTTYNNQFKGGAIQFNTEYGITIRKAEHIQLDLYFEGNGKAHIKMEESVGNIVSYLYGGNGSTLIDMDTGIILINSFITLDGRSWKHKQRVIEKDPISVVRSRLRRLEGTLTNDWTNVIEETLENIPTIKWKGSELIDSSWYRKDSLSKISLKSNGAVEFTTGGEAIDFKDTKIINFGGIKHRWLSGPPASGNSNKGDIVYNTNPSSGGYVGWVCITNGTPGIWKGFGLIIE